jgi:hypothetical protein
VLGRYGSFPDLPRFGKPPPEFKRSLATRRPSKGHINQVVPLQVSESL